MSNSTSSSIVLAKRQRRESDTSTTKGKSIHERYNSGELEIISSDGVIFKLDPAYLRAGSQVFRDMIDVSNDTSNPIELTDDENETASLVAIVLDAFHGKPIIGDSRHFATLLQVITFVEKYDCTALQQHLQQELRANLLFKNLSSFRIFILLSKLGDVEGCAAAIRNHGHNSWPSSLAPDVRNSDRSLHARLCNVGWADPSSWSLDDALMVDVRFHCALNRAFKISKATHPLGIKQLERLAKEFYGLLINAL